MARISVPPPVGDPLPVGDLARPVTSPSCPLITVEGEDDAGLLKAQHMGSLYTRGAAFLYFKVWVELGVGVGGCALPPLHSRLVRMGSRSRLGLWRPLHSQVLRPALHGLFPSFLTAALASVPFLAAMYRKPTLLKCELTAPVY